MGRCTQAGDKHLAGARVPGLHHRVVEQRQGQAPAPVALVRPGQFEFGGPRGLVEPDDGAAEVGVVLPPHPGQFADGGVVVLHFRPRAVICWARPRMTTVSLRLVG
jgi:hypothetical protein